jgi:hypothetical protein
VKGLLVALVAWSLFVWPTRIRNVWGDHTASAASKWSATALSLSFVAFSVVAVVGLVRSRRRDLAPWVRVVARAFAAWTTGVWLVFGTLILVHDHPAAFKAVHVALGLISIGLAAAVWRGAKLAAAMGQPVTVIEKPSPRTGVVRFEINRSITGMGIERYRSPDAIVGDRPPDRLAAALFAHGGVASVTVSSNVITVALAAGGSSAGMRELIEELFLYYREGVEVAQPT